jgi:hypothetical protein
MLQQSTNLNKIFIVFISLFIIITSYTINIDKQGESIVEDSLVNAIKVFAVAKGLNGAISLAQGTEINAAVLTITIGEVLDPINDLVEQFSWIMLASITSLGIQKILLNFVTGDIFTYIVVASIIILNIWMFVRFSNDIKIRDIFFRVTIILIFLRFSIPVMSMLNSFVYEHYVKNDYNIEMNQNLIDKSSQEINNITQQTIADKDIVNETKSGSLYDSVKETFNSVTNNIFNLEYYKNKVKEYQSTTEKTSDYILNLIVAFSFKTIFFPLVFLFLLYQLLKSVIKIGK